jgi:hypothetical protein
MARYRVGDTYLSQGEYNAYRESRFALWAVLLSVFSSALLIRMQIDPNEFSKPVRFALVVLGSGLVGGAVFALRKVLRVFVKALVVLWIVVFVGQLLWRIV